MKFAYLFILFATALFLSGCLHAPQENEQVLPEEASTSTSTETSQNDIDTSDWKTYTNEEYGFSFQYPEEWVSSSEIQGEYEKNISIYGASKNNGINIFIESVDKAPSSELGGDTSIRTKDQLLALQKQLNNNSQLINSIPIDVSLEYDVPGGDFFQRAQFFVHDSLITLAQSVKIEHPQIPWGTEKRKIVQDIIQEFENETVGSELIKQKERFETVISTLELI